MSNIHSKLENLVSSHPFVRFILSGGLNTATTYILFLVLLEFVNYKISFTIAYWFGIFTSYFFNKLFVFKSSPNFLSFLVYPLVYLFQYFFSLGVTWIWVEVLNLKEIYSPIIAIILSIPVTFTLSRIILTK